jgi:sigma-B regulation protein RsbU (phosphoserine phosphatase)
MGGMRNVEARVFNRLRLPAPNALLGRLAFWLVVVTALATPGRWLPGEAGALFTLFNFFSLAALVSVLFALAWRYTLGRFLWKVSNRLIVTYLLMGLAPVVLFAVLASIAMYAFLGQFAIFAASGELERSLQSMASQNMAFTHTITHTLEAHTPAPGDPVPLPDRDADIPDEVLAPNYNLARNTPAGITAFLDTKPLKLFRNGRLEPEGVTRVPSWVPAHFFGVVLADGHLYLRAVDVAPFGAHRITVVSSLPLEHTSIDRFAQGLGRITIVPQLSLDRDSNNGATPISTEDSEQHAAAVLPNTIVGGNLPPASHFFDLPVNFFAPLSTVDWETGARHDSGVHITSRPSPLFERLFSTSLQVATYVQNTLLALAAFFGLLELTAFLMAMRLNRTITQSIGELYAATLAIDGGSFTHRIEVKRRDQLAALSASFNTMTASLERLLVEQREKERLEGELEIAQQVQANLFPKSNVSLPTLEVFGICQPARTVSGDYYDFLVAGSSGLSLALGDISGKGISAALLMASLHSAVRAYRFMGEDMALAGPAQADRLSRIVRAGSDDTTRHDDGMGLPPLAAAFGEPGQILGLLNRHLYRSTQPEKYATLFLAHYDGRTGELTYSTGGQPPPLLLRTDDSVVRLDCGGTVIGLMDAMQYDQGRAILRPGDIVIAYSDGVTEPENEYGDFGEDRLLELVRRYRRLPLEQIADHVMQALRSWIGPAEQPDDITLVLARQR